MQFIGIDISIANRGTKSKAGRSFYGRQNAQENLFWKIFLEKFRRIFAPVFLDNAGENVLWFWCENRICPRDAGPSRPQVFIRKEAAAVGLFPSFDWDEEEGEEIAPELPRKTGFPRLWELVCRDFWDNFRSGFLALVGCLPFAVGIFFAVTTRAMLLAPLAGLIGGAVAGPELCAQADTLLRGLRDDVGRAWWPTYRKAWRRGVKASLLPGALGGALLGTQLFMLFHADLLQLGAATGTALVMGVLLLLGLSLYLWPQLALMDLSLGQIIKNSALLFIGQLPRTAAALAVYGVYILVSLRFGSFALSLLPLSNFWLPTLPALFLVYPGLNQAFDLEQKFQGEQIPPESL